MACTLSVDDDFEMLDLLIFHLVPRENEPKWRDYMIYIGRFSCLAPFSETPHLRRWYSSFYVTFYCCCFSQTHLYKLFRVYLKLRPNDSFSFGALFFLLHKHTQHTHNETMTRIKCVQFAIKIDRG